MKPSSRGGFSIGFKLSGATNTASAGVKRKGDSEREETRQQSWFDDDDDERPREAPKRKIPRLNDDDDDVGKGSETPSWVKDEDDDDAVGDLDDEGFASSRVRNLLSKNASMASSFVKAGPASGQKGSVPASRPIGHVQPPPKEPAEEEYDPANATTGPEDEDEDELDSFMAGLQKDIQQEETRAKSKPDQPERLDQEDDLEDYVEWMRERGVEVGKGGGDVTTRREDVDSDEEVYATAKLIDEREAARRAGGAVDSDDELMKGPPMKRGKKDDWDSVLPKIDHSKMEYEEIGKDFYEEHPDLTRLTPAQVSATLSSLHATITGPSPPRPATAFAHLNLPSALLSAVRRHGYSTPTPIQACATPVALQGRDLIGLAKTGSGKTAAYLLPMCVHATDQRWVEKGEGPVGLVLVPTRELAGQVGTEAKKFASALEMGVSVIAGGADKHSQFKELRSSTPPTILVATPGRLIDLLRMKATNMHRVSFIVLDEADRMLDLGFEPQVRAVLANVRPDRQTLMFSATFPRRIERLARDVLQEPVRVAVGEVGVASEMVDQSVEVVKEEGDKWAWLARALPGFLAVGQVIVFSTKKEGVDQLSTALTRASFSCVSIHGDHDQRERDSAISVFRKGTVKLLVATDVAARGLDVPGVKTVVNYDAARDIEAHVHRVGRTGRAGVKGTAWTILTEKEDRFASDLVRNLEQAGQQVSPQLMALAMRNPRFRSFRDGSRGRARGGRGRGRGGGRGGGVGGGRSGIGIGGGDGGAGVADPQRPWERIHGGGGTGSNRTPVATTGGGVSVGGMTFSKTFGQSFHKAGAGAPPAALTGGAGGGGGMMFAKASSVEGSSTSWTGGAGAIGGASGGKPPGMSRFQKASSNEGSSTSWTGGSGCGGGSANGDGEKRRSRWDAK